MRCLLVIILLAAAQGAGKDKKLEPVTGEDEYLFLTAEVFAERQSVTGVLGQDPGQDLVIVDVKLAPRGETKVAVNLDDFTLISRKDGQKSQPLAPSQIAGSTALVVAQGGRGGGIGTMNPRGPIWGGYPGTGTRPRRIGGDDAAILGEATETKAAVSETSKESDNPLLDALKQKALPQRETNESVRGLLYFFLEGKHKVKDLELMYKSPAGRMMLDFQK